MENDAGEGRNSAQQGWGWEREQKGEWERVRESKRKGEKKREKEILHKPVKRESAMIIQ